jgi:hypothetical protein
VLLRHSVSCFPAALNSLVEVSGTSSMFSVDGLLGASVEQPFQSGSAQYCLAIVPFDGL